VLAHAKELGPDGHAGGLALGTGALDWDRYLSLLRSAKFDGPLIMHGFEERDVSASVKFLREKLGSEKKK
jgi:sugar phosphate isomerase/epimerase